MACTPLFSKLGMHYERTCVNHITYVNLWFICRGFLSIGIVHKATYVEGLAELLVWIWVRTINELEESVGEVQDET